MQLQEVQNNLQVALEWLQAQGYSEKAAILQACSDQLAALNSATRTIEAEANPEIEPQRPGNVKPVAVPAHSYPVNNTRYNKIQKLTRREIEVLRLVTQGLTNAQVAEKLVLAPRTVNVHLTSIYSKLGVNSRTAATRYAFDQHLI